MKNNIFPYLFHFGRASNIVVSHFVEKKSWPCLGSSPTNRWSLSRERTEINSDEGICSCIRTDDRNQNQKEYHFELKNGHVAGVKCLGVLPCQHGQLDLCQMLLEVARDRAEYYSVSVGSTFGCLTLLAAIGG